MSENGTNSTVGDDNSYNDLATVDDTESNEFNRGQVRAIQGCTAPNPENGLCNFTNLEVSSGSKVVSLSRCHIYNRRIDAQRLEVLSGSDGSTQTDGRFKEVSVQTNGAVGPSNPNNGCSHRPNRLFIYDSNGSLQQQTASTANFRVIANHTTDFRDWFWPKRVSGKHYSVKFITCSKVIETKVVAYPDINWELTLTLPEVPPHTTPWSRRTVTSAHTDRLIEVRRSNGSTRRRPADSILTTETQTGDTTAPSSQEFDLTIECKENGSNSTRFDISRYNREIKTKLKKIEEVKNFVQVLSETIQEFSTGYYLRFTFPSGSIRLRWGWYDDPNSTLCKYSVLFNVNARIIGVKAGFDVAGFISNKIRRVIEIAPGLSSQVALQLSAKIEIDGALNIEFNAEEILVSGVDNRSRFRNELLASIRIAVTLEASLELRAFVLECSGTLGVYTGITGSLGFGTGERNGTTFIKRVIFDGIIIRAVVTGEVAGMRRRYQAEIKVAERHAWIDEETPLFTQSRT